MWFSKSVEQTLNELQVDAGPGLTDQEGEARLLKYVANKLQGQKKKTILQLFMAQLQNALIYAYVVTLGIVPVILNEIVKAIVRYRQKKRINIYKL